MQHRKYIAYLPRVIGGKLCRHRRIHFVVCTLLVIALLIFSNLPVHFVFTNSNIHEPCVLPRLDPFDKTIMKFVTKLDPLNCGSVPPLFFVDKEGYLNLNSTSLERVGESEGSIKCTYSEVVRQAGDIDVSLSRAVAITPPVRLEHDFVRINCMNIQLDTIYDETITNIATPEKQGGGHIGRESPDEPSVLLFGVDSTSRSAAIRFLPRTHAYLTEILSAYDFKGMMKVGDNTIRNMIPLLTGRRVFSTELPHTNYITNYFDDFPFIWKNFSERKYVTLFAEDMPTRHMFNNNLKGFKMPPTDHYMRPFWLSTFSGVITDTFNKLKRYLGSKAIDVGHDKVFCTGSMPSHRILINYVKQFIHGYKGHRKFAMSFLTEIGHEYQTYLQYADDDFVDFFKWMNTEGHLRNTILVFFSDHGSRYDFVRNTYVGRVESRMPVLHIYIPNHLKAKYPNMARNLDINSNRLVTFYDLHQTLNDVLNKNYDKPSKLYVDGKLRGLSLFDTIPEKRSCAEAWISQEFCACFGFSPVNLVNEKFVTDIVKQILFYINGVLDSDPQCAKLDVFDVKEVRQMQQGLKYIKTETKGVSLFQFARPEEKRLGQYLVSLETVPGHGLFDVTIEYDSKSSVHILGEVERTNKYGNQSHCTNHAQLKQMCFCSS